MSMPDKPAHDWESPASRKTPQDGETGQRSTPPDGNGHAPGKTPPQDSENAPRINGFDWEKLATGEIPPLDNQYVRSISGFDWESLASGTTPRGGETEQRSTSPVRKGPVPDRMSSQDGSASHRSMPSGRKDPASRWPSLQGEGAGDLTRLLLAAYLLLPLSIIALAALHHFLAPSQPRYALEIGLFPEDLRMLAVFVCIGPAAILALLGLWRARRENHPGAAAHACALLLSLLHCVNIYLLWLLSVEADPGPAGPVASAGFSQVLQFIIELPARLCSWLFHCFAFIEGGWTFMRVFLGCTTLLKQKKPALLIWTSTASFLPVACLLLFSGVLLWEIR